MPGYPFDGSDATGMYRPAGNTLGFSTGGSERLRVESDGTLVVSTANYENLVLNDDDIPNKKYVDDAIPASAVVFSGFVQINAVGSDLPAGWTVVKGPTPFTGRYTVTHGLNLSTSTDLRVVVTQSGNPGTFGHFIYVFPGVNSFLVEFRNSSNLLQNLAFFFMAIEG